ncbi:MAG: MBL fold metallo-hydrolase [Planctomycetes bacterium]|nr:MBL fold metallo-hydrolase [Planctomycetota bacterium]
MIEITFLGSGTGIPDVRRASPGILVKSNNNYILMDSGPGALRQLAKLKLNSNRIGYILYTHLHPDHTTDLIAFLFSARYQILPASPKDTFTAATQRFIQTHKRGFRTAPLTIIGPKGLKKFYRQLMTLYGPWLKPVSYKLTIREVLDSSFKIGDLRIASVQMQHQKFSVGYRLTTPSNRSVAYSGDTEYCPGVVKLARNADILITECSAPDEVPMPYHLTPSAIARIMAESGARSRNGVPIISGRKVILTHLYPLCAEHDIVKQVKRNWPGPVKLAADLMRFRL